MVLINNSATRDAILRGIHNDIEFITTQKKDGKYNQFYQSTLYANGNLKVVDDVTMQDALDSVSKLRVRIKMLGNEGMNFAQVFDDEEEKALYYQAYNVAKQILIQEDNISRIKERLTEALELPTFIMDESDVQKMQNGIGTIWEFQNEINKLYYELFQVTEKYINKGTTK